MRKMLDWGHKEPDSNAQTGNRTVKRPFDGFGVLEGIPVYWESKYLPEPVGRIARSKIFSRKHQVENLINLHNKYELKGTACLSLFCIFMRTGYSKLDLYIISNQRLKEVYFSKENSFIIREISEFMTNLSTNLKNENLDLWKLLHNEE